MKKHKEGPYSKKVTENQFVAHYWQSTHPTGRKEEKSDLATHLAADLIKSRGAAGSSIRRLLGDGSVEQGTVTDEDVDVDALIGTITGPNRSISSRLRLEGARASARVK